MKPENLHTIGVAFSELLRKIAILSRKLYLANPYWTVIYTIRFCVFWLRFFIDFDYPHLI